MAKEYIEREALIDTIFPIGMPNDGNYHINAKSVRVAIEKQPTADVVEVVRCKDCKIGFKKFIKGIEVIECQRHNYNDPKQYKRLDDFCSYGERKEK